MLRKRVNDIAEDQQRIPELLSDTDSDEFNYYDSEDEFDESTFPEDLMPDTEETCPKDFDRSDQFTWKTEVRNEDTFFHPFLGEPGPVHDLPVDAKAFHYFRLFFTDEVCSNLKDNTNSYAEWRMELDGENKNWFPVDHISELWAFFSILMVMSIVNLPQINDYWSANPILKNDFVKNLMTRDRFRNFYRYFHVSDINYELSSENENFSILQKVEPLFRTLKRKFKEHYRPHKQLSMDEAMIKYKGRLGFVQYSPLKPAKRGIKMWMLRSAHLGYTVDFDVYADKKGTIQRSNQSLGYDVVMHPIKSLKGVSHEVYSDGFFTSLPLMRDLFEYNKFMSGVDQADHRRQYYSAARKSRKGWLNVFWFLFETAVNNAFLLYTLTNTPLEKHPKTLYKFKLELIEELGAKLSSHKKNFAHGSEPSNIHVHKKVRIEGRKKTCVGCRKTGVKTPSGRNIESSWKCEKCAICLCLKCMAGNLPQN